MHGRSPLELRHTIPAQLLALGSEAEPTSSQSLENSSFLLTNKYPRNRWTRGGRGSSLCRAVGRADASEAGAGLGTERRRAGRLESSPRTRTGALGARCPGWTECFTWQSESGWERRCARTEAGSQQQEPEQDASD